VAVVHKFRRNATDLDLNAAAGAGWRTVAWNPKVATPGPGAGPLEESVTFLADCASQNDLATKLQAMHEMRGYAAEYVRNRVQEYPVWWHVKAYSETGERRALVRAVEMEMQCPVVTRADWIEGNRALIRARVTREPYWERTTSVSMPTATPSAAVSVTYDYTASPGADVVGDAPARIARLTVDPTVGSSSLGRLWIGLRSANRHGTLANFANIWECEDNGASMGTDAARAPDATASPGGAGNTKVTVTPGTATWAKRWSMNLATDAGTGKEVDNYGEFLWLVRCTVSAGTWEIQSRWGYSGMDDADRVAGPIKEVSSTSWDYIDSGYQPIPLRSLKAFPTGTLSGNFDMLYQMQIWARRTSGSGTLDLDGVCPIPLDEGWLRAWDFSASESPRERFEFAEAPHGISQGLTATASPSIPSFMPLASDRFRLPIGDGRMIIVYARESSSVLTDAVRLNLATNLGEYYPRWCQLRGSE